MYNQTIAYFYHREYAVKVLINIFQLCIKSNIIIDI